MTKEARIILETERLRLRELALNDAPFILRLLNEPSFIQNIGDRGVRSIEDASAYLSKGPLCSYREHGFGLWRVEEKRSGSAIGMCGLLKREVLKDVDVGYALLPEFWSQGYAREATLGVLNYAGNILGLERVAAVVNSDNQRSIRLLEQVGFNYERMIRLNDEAEEIKLFTLSLVDQLEPTSR